MNDSSTAHLNLGRKRNGTFSDCGWSSTHLDLSVWKTHRFTFVVNWCFFQHQYSFISSHLYLLKNEITSGAPGCNLQISSAYVTKSFQPPLASFCTDSWGHEDGRIRRRFLGTKVEEGSREPHMRACVSSIIHLTFYLFFSLQRQPLSRHMNLHLFWINVFLN